MRSSWSINCEKFEKSEFTSEFRKRQNNEWISLYWFGWRWSIRMRIFFQHSPKMNNYLIIWIIITFLQSTLFRSFQMNLKSIPKSIIFLVYKLILYLQTIQLDIQNHIKTILKVWNFSDNFQSSTCFFLNILIH